MGRKKFSYKKENPWKTICPSPIPFQETWHVPQEMKLSDIERVKKQFISASLKAVEIGFDLIEIHGTHGYLLHQFYLQFQINVKINMEDNLENRMRFPLEIFFSQRCLPKNFPLGMRITGTEWENMGLMKMKHYLRKRIRKNWMSLCLCL